ncbi:hypothetical protein DFJ77DRAFT_438967 [Powellomyces hirtus]|nr:hypothetical protein DFJ77DRAFT_438967 [Powellomyces hirtus]
MLVPLPYAIEDIPQTPASTYLFSLPHAPTRTASQTTITHTHAVHTPPPPLPNATPQQQPQSDSYFNLPTRKTKRPHPTSPGGIYEHLVCPLCFVLPHRMSLLPCCGNSICAECASVWVKTHPTCPFCRADLDAVVNGADPQDPPTKDGHTDTMDGEDVPGHDIITIESVDGDADDADPQVQPIDPLSVGSPLQQQQPQPQSQGQSMSDSSYRGGAPEQTSTSTLVSPATSPTPPATSPASPLPSTVRPRKKKHRRRIIHLPPQSAAQTLLDDIPVFCPFREKGADEAENVAWAGGCRWTGSKNIVRKHLEMECQGILDPNTHHRTIDLSTLEFIGLDTPKPEPPPTSNESDDSDDDDAHVEHGTTIVHIHGNTYVVTDAPHQTMRAPGLFASPVRLCFLFGTSLLIVVVAVYLVIQRVSTPTTMTTTYMPGMG